MTKTIVTAAAVGLWLAVAPPANADDGNNFNLLLETRQGENAHGTSALQAYRLQLDGIVEWNPQWKLKSSLVASNENQLDVGTYHEQPVHELLLNYNGQACTVNAGMQQVVWGQADRLRVLDVINPMNLRESYFGSWEHKRLPLAMVNTECGIGDNALQLLLIPQTRFNEDPSPAGRFWTPGIAGLLANKGIPVQSTSLPSESRPADWNAGIQWSGRLQNIDYTLNAYHGWQPEKQLAPIPGPIPQFQSQAARYTLWGGSLTAPVGPLVARAEATRASHVTVYGTNALGLPAPADATQNTGLLALDYQAEPWFFNVQYFAQDTSADLSPGISGRQRMLTFGIRRSFLQDRGKVSLYSAYDIEHPASYLSLETSYDLNQNLQASLTLENFDGSELSFGRFRREKRAFVGLKYSLK
ncbi:hypothetical protein BI347_08110 [Chromobacterium sphagni]|uniref:Porin domain-containing protein n=1 Tax=Chromobacterium sphagni TaxID=1903179 RepID=A0A1S1X227_9NEIS|nr:DUF1302 family protein [Chromobacterium sphagni]OHX13479.1 hypothetical protein BI347_08110 [Chromobacterium sphagni]